MDFVDLSSFFRVVLHIDSYYINKKDNWLVIRFFSPDKDCFYDLPIYDFNTNQLNDINNAIINIKKSWHYKH